MNWLKICIGFILGVVLLSSCDKEDNLENVKNDLPPGKEYIAEGKHCVNVVYYIPMDLDSIPGWHKRLSGTMLYAQDFFRRSMNWSGYGEKTFRLVVNKQNPSYIRIIYLKSKLHLDKDCNNVNVTAEITEYFRKNPEEMVSKHTIVYLPEGKSGMFNGWYSQFGNNNEISDMFWALISSDNMELGLVENSLGGIVHELGHSFCLPHTSERAVDNYASLMYAGNVYWNMNELSYVQLTPGDAMWLDQIEVFNDNDKEYYTETPKVIINTATVTADRENIYVKCDFTSAQNIVGFIAYNDPWASDDRSLDLHHYQWTEYDAVNYSTKELNRNGNNYSVSMTLPWEDLPAKYKNPRGSLGYSEAEIRFRFVFEGGLSVPIVGKSVKGQLGTLFRFPYKIKSNYPDFDDPVTW